MGYKETLYKAGILEKGRKTQPNAPWEVQLTSLAEDAGLVNIATKGMSFENCMFSTSFIVSDFVLHLIVAACIIYTAIVAGWV